MTNRSSDSHSQVSTARVSRGTGSHISLTQRVRVTDLITWIYEAAIGNSKIANSNFSCKFQGFICQPGRSDC